MKKKDLYNILNHKNKLSESEVTDLEKFIEEHPYFETGRLVLLHDLIEKKSPKAYDSLNEQSFFIRDKSDLFDKISAINAPKNQGKSIEHIEKVLEGSEKSEKSDKDEPALGEPTPIIDFTDDLLNELEILGKGVKEMKIESFPDTKPSADDSEKAEKKNLDKPTPSEPVKEETKKVTSTRKTTKSTTTAKQALKSSPVSSEQKQVKEPDLADKVMAELAQMKAERAQAKETHASPTETPKSGTKRKPASTTSKTADKKKEEEAKPAPKRTTRAKTTKTPTNKSTTAKASNKKRSSSTAKKASTSTAKKTSGSNTGKKSETKTTAKKETLSKTEKKVPEKPRDKKGEKRIIDSFIKSEIKIRPRDPDKVEKNPEDLSKPSTELPSNLISENLAKIFEKQGKTSKAISIYKELILKYPDKKSYFAAKIEKLEK